MKHLNYYCTDSDCPHEHPETCTRGPIANTVRAHHTPMTNTQENWEKEFDEGRKEQFNSGDPYWPNWDGIKSFIREKLAAARIEGAQGMWDLISAEIKDLNMTYQAFLETCEFLAKRQDRTGTEAAIILEQVRKKSASLLPILDTRAQEYLKNLQ
jgi:hypothetical protein